MHWKRECVYFSARYVPIGTNGFDVCRAIERDFSEAQSVSSAAEKRDNAKLTKHLLSEDRCTRFSKVRGETSEFSIVSLAEGAGS